MKKSILGLAALALLQSGALFAQKAAGPNLSGTWQGLMLVSDKPGDVLHVVFKITTNVSGTLSATMYSIDQGGQAPAPDITLKGSTVKIGMPSIGATYTGNLNGDGNSITGQWAATRGGGPPLTLNLSRATAETAWKIPEPPPPPKMMPADADPGFEVASVKLSSPDRRMVGLGLKGQQFTVTGMTVHDLIRFAYGIHPRQIAGAPDWIEKDRYDVVAKLDIPGQPSERQMRTLIQKLLADRFSLKSHREKRELPVYALVVVKSGAKITKSEGDPKGDPTMFFYGPGKFIAKNATMANFAELLQGGVVDRPVIDQTGLDGRYDFGLVFRPDQPLASGRGDGPPPAPSDQDALDDIYASIQTELGLRLEAMKTPTDVMVIDRLEKPSEN